MLYRKLLYLPISLPDLRRSHKVIISRGNFHYLYSRKNFKFLFCAGIVLAVAVRIYIFHPMRMTYAILPGSPPLGNIKGRANHFSPSSRFPTGQQQDKPANMTEHILTLCFLAEGKTSQHEGAHSLFFTDSSSPTVSYKFRTVRSAP